MGVLNEKRCKKGYFYLFLIFCIFCIFCIFDRCLLFDISVLYKYALIIGIKSTPILDDNKQNTLFFSSLYF